MVCRDQCEIVGIRPQAILRHVDEALAEEVGDTATMLEQLFDRRRFRGGVGIVGQQRAERIRQRTDPRSSTRAIAVFVKILLIEPRLKRVLAVIGVRRRDRPGHRPSRTPARRSSRPGRRRRSDPRRPWARASRRAHSRSSASDIVGRIGGRSSLGLFVGAAHLDADAGDAVRRRLLDRQLDAALEAGGSSDVNRVRPVGSAPHPLNGERAEIGADTLDERLAVCGGPLRQEIWRKGVPAMVSYAPHRRCRGPPRRRRPEPYWRAPAPERPAERSS